MASNQIDDPSQLSVNILDIDGDQNYDALTDGILILRSLFGLEGSELISGAVSDNGIYQNAESIQSRLTTFKPYFDVDQNGQIDALTDGLLILRFLFGLSDESLINNTIAQGAQRSSPTEISQYLLELSPQFNKPNWGGISFYAEEPQGPQWIDATYRRLTESERAESKYSSLVENFTRTNMGLFFHQNTGFVSAIEDDFEGSEGSDNWGIDIGDQIATADINGDGFEDIILSHRFAPNKSPWKAKVPILILVNQKNGLLEVDPCIYENCTIPYSNEAYLPHVNDFNGDDNLDFITIGADPVVLMSSENGIKDTSQNFKSMLIEQRVGGNTENVGEVWTHTTAVGDLDNNGTLDMYIPSYILDRYESCGGHPAGCQNFTLLNDGDGNFVAGSADFPFTGNVWGSAIADFDNDGYGDILISLDDIQENHIFYSHKHWSTSSGMIMFGNSEGNYRSDIFYLDTSLLGEHFVGLEFFIDDLDNDGDEDIIAIQTGDGANYYKGNEIQIFKNNGDRTFDDISSVFVDRSLEPYLETHANLDFKLPAAYFQYTDIDNDGDKDLWPKTGQYNQPYYLRTDSGFSLAGLVGAVLDYGEEANNCENQCASTFYAGLAIDIDRNGVTDFFQMEVIDSVGDKSGYVASQLMTIKDPFSSGND